MTFKKLSELEHYMWQINYHYIKNLSKKDLQDHGIEIMEQIWAECAGL